LGADGGKENILANAAAEAYVAAGGPANGCVEVVETSVFCANTASQIQGDENAVALCSEQAEAAVVEATTGASGPDVFVGTVGNDLFRGLGGNDTLRGLAGNDRLVGGRDKDRLFGGLGDDVLNGGPGADLANGGPGDDVCGAEKRRGCP
jgi:Ca2+-binding RTX toxin-like protein